MNARDPRWKVAGWQDDMDNALLKAQAAVARAEAAAEEARQAINALTHAASKHKLSRTPPFQPITALDIRLHKNDSPSNLYAEARVALVGALRAIKQGA